jgi:hypothetical protein
MAESWIAIVIVRRECCRETKEKGAAEGKTAIKSGEDGGCELYGTSGEFIGVECRRAEVEKRPEGVSFLTLGPITSSLRRFLSPPETCSSDGGVGWERGAAHARQNARASEGVHFAPTLILTPLALTRLSEPRADEEITEQRRLAAKSVHDDQRRRMLSVLGSVRGGVGADGGEEL